MEEIIFPNQIRMIRRTRGRTMKEIAAVLGVSLSAVSKIEKGYRRIDEVQLDKIASFLNCPKESVFVYEKTSQPEVLQAWDKERERRTQINENSGLKTLGAGFRFLRGEKMLTLLDVAKGAGLTLSVYHRIEMGQREVSEDQFVRIAHALGYSAEDLQLKIYELDMAGTLQEFKKSGKSGIFHPKGGYNDLPLRNITFDTKANMDVYQFDKVDLPPVKQQIQIPDLSQCFAVRMSGILPDTDVNIIVSNEADVKQGDYVVYQDKQAFLLGRFVSENGEVVFQSVSGERRSVPKEQLKKVAAILI